MNTTFIRWIQTHFTKDNLGLAVRISVGIIISILLADFIGVDFAASTGIVTLLTVQSTKLETFHTAVRRIISFLYTLGIAYLIHDFIAMDIEAFALVVFGIVIISIFLGWSDTLSVNIVIATHLFIMQEPFTMHLILNETLRVVIGMCIAIFINSYIPGNEKRYTVEIHKIELKISSILVLYSNYLNGNSDLTAVPALLDELNFLLERGQDSAIKYYNNKMRPYARYYISYMTMRESECTILTNIYHHLNSIEELPATSVQVADFIRHFSGSIPVEHMRDDWENLHEDLKQKMFSGPLPGNRTEFTSQAFLFNVLNELYQVIQLKHLFILNVTDTQKKLYWNPVQK
ncbi:aromatic acid exporter family protein [Hespellia stercorisuis]|uniref:Uncharacterized membrane protein YgaE, UPF0421/DUF939 family n=1 Tax=Hespellia stercorisuis DSM 15480 TaxID=1121950 RepID=A0A1M6QD38_9FIRM|nr:aromatic acid exporter family protein [Hespellia stercorisuis]SHK17987.1 Uncharacterized membrane protein YgaE, UPF0421/DUF939 family [Hespellia stercorisuis DSM 15480]